MDEDIFKPVGELLNEMNNITTEPDGIVTELTNQTLPEDNEDAYNDYRNEEINAIRANQNN